MENKKTAFITGANKGIGFATTKLLAERGYQVWMGVRNKEHGEQAYQVLKDQNLDVRLVQIDISKDDSVTKAAAYLKEQLGKLDILINNAGYAEDLSLSPTEESIAAIKRQFEVNTFGPIRVTQALLPLLKKAPKASIIMLSSIVGSLALSSDESTIYGQVNFAGYSSSKTALNALIVAFAKELKSFEIPVIAIEPGHIKTDLNNNSGTDTPEKAATLVVDYAINHNLSKTGKFYGPQG